MKTESGLVAVAWIRPGDIGMPDAYVSDEKPFSDWIPLVRLSDAEAIIAQKDAEIERLSLYKNLAAEYGLSVFADLSKQSSALKLAREALLTICGAYPSSKTLEALAAIDAAMQEDKP